MNAPRLAGAVPPTPLLLFAGLDPTGQAGLARDLVVCRDERIHACPVNTGATVQTSGGFSSANATPPEVLVAQAEAALAEHGPRWAKVGALFSAEQVRAVARLAARHRLRLVLDPVLSSTSGGRFLDDEGRSALLALLPHCALVTPNAAEATALTGAPDPAHAAQALVADGAGAALVTRGGEGADLLWDGERLTEFPATHQDGRHRGTGCRLATRIAALLALDVPPRDAVAAAHAALQSELALDAAEQALGGDRLAHFQELERWLPRILAEIRFEHVPEVGSNLAYALRGATDPRRDVLGLAGRITIAGFGRAVTGRLAYGGPHHTGRIAVVLQEYDPDARVVMNHRFDEAFLAAARRGGLTDSSFRRADEPPDAPSSMEWGFRHAIETHGTVPDLVWDRGGEGKEAMIRVLARDPEDLVRKLRLLHAVDAAPGDPDGRPRQ